MIRPRLSYGLNADFEDHAEHEYMTLVAENPQWDTEPYDVAFSATKARSSRSPMCCARSATTNECGSLEAIKQPRFR